MTQTLLGRRAFLLLGLILILAFAASVDARAATSVKRGAKAASFSDGGGWHVQIAGNEASPQRLIAVDKKQQQLFLLERHSPLKLAGKFACTTGKKPGDKFVEGDLKTPEGVYFVVTRLASGLNFEKYGYEAYTLNYPNPVDKLRRKTGYGIWIHGRGAPITPNLTEGCVSLNNSDLDMLGKNLTPGTPVTLAAGVNVSSAPSPEEQAAIDALHRKTYGWAKAWASKSKTLFDFYDPEAYSLAQGERFSNFKAQKERVFKKVSWIDIKIRNVQALQGPGYWVTWFQQDYKASNLSAKGVRRLYWQKDAKGEFRIVGMEWAPNLSGTLTAGLSHAPISLEKSSLQAVKTPPPADVHVKKTPPAPNASKAGSTPKRTSTALAEKSRGPHATPKGPSLTDVSVFVESWRRAWEKGDLAAYAACYAKDAVQGSRKGAAAIKAHKNGLWKHSKPKQVVLTNIRIASKQDTITVDMHQSYTDSKSFADMGRKTLYLKAKGNGWSIVREDWSPMQQ